MIPTRLYFFGPPRCERDGQPVDLPAKAIGLLGYLALAETAAPRERLLGLFWGESAEEAARKNLRNTLWAIRRALGEEALLADGDRLALGAAVWADVRQFEQAHKALDRRAAPVPPTLAQLRAAADLYTGPFLDGLALVEAPEFELWLTAERERLAQAVLALWAAEIAAHAQMGDWRSVAARARRVLAHDSLQEPAVRALMEAQARLGARSEALHQYDVLRSILARELGVEPLPETEALRAAILAGAFDVPAAEPAAAARPSGERPSPLRVAASLPFIGRAQQWAALDAQLAAASAGQARGVLITGELGIGKSRLWREWSAAAPAGCMVLEARCLAATQGLPFAPLTELFGSHPAISELLRPGSPVLISWLAEVARLLPQVRQARGDLPAPALLPPEEERRRVFEAFVQLLSAITARPLVVFVDDVHWIDHATLDWLAYLVHRMHDRALLLVLAYRSEEAPADLVRQVAAWGREGLIQRLPLDRLNGEEAAALIAALRVDPTLAHSLQAQSAGNPYFLIELSRAVNGGAGSPMPPPLVELVRARLGRLPDSARQVLQAAAVLEPDFAVATLRQTSGRSEEETLDALDVLLGAGVLQERADAYTFAHPLVAAVVRADLSSARRAFLHRRAAVAVAALYAGRPGLAAGRLALHHAQAGDSVQAAHYADLAAEHALMLSAPAEAVAFYWQALALEPTPGRQMGLGGALYRLGDLGAARRAYEAALAGYGEAGDTRGQARACLSIAGAYLPIGQPDEVVRWARRGLEVLDAQVDPAAHARAHFLLGAGRLRAGGDALVEAEGHLAEANRLAEEHGLLDVAMVGRFELGNLHAERGDLAGALALYEGVIGLARVAGDPNQEVLAHNNAAYHAMLAGDLTAAHRHLDAALAQTESLDLRLARQYLLSTRGEIALAERLWDEAETWFRQGLAEAQNQGNGEQVAKYHANLALAARGRGDLDAALILLEEAQQAAAPLTARYVQAQIALWLTELHLARGERLVAAEALGRAEDYLAGGQYGNLNAWAQRLRTQL